MSYSVFVRRLARGESIYTPFAEVVAILQKYGTVAQGPFGFEFIPDGKDICQSGSIEGDPDQGILSVWFDRPRSGRLAALVFELLGIPGMCYMEQDIVHIYARTDITADLPQDFRDDSDIPGVTVVSSPSDMAMWGEEMS